MRALAQRFTRAPATIAAWLNLGDNYAATTRGSSGKGDQAAQQRGDADRRSRGLCLGDSSRRDLVGIPWRVAFALQEDDGWWLRSDIIWSKTEPMPESVTDRPTRA